MHSKIASMANRQGLISQIWRNIKHTLVVSRAKEVCVGIDENGNKFFERLAVPEKNIKLVRRVESADGDTWNAPEVPTEWLAWLQNKRVKPPTPEEIERNYLRMIRTRHRAAELEKSLQEAPQRDERENLPTQANQGPSFPRYEEFENDPGEFKKGPTPRR